MRSDACEDFLILVMKSHIIVAAMTMLGMKTLDDGPSVEYAAEGNGIWIMQLLMVKGLSKVTEDLVEKYVEISSDSPLNHFCRTDKVQSCYANVELGMPVHGI